MCASDSYGYKDLAEVPKHVAVKKDDWVGRGGSGGGGGVDESEISVMGTVFP